MKKRMALKQFTALTAIVLSLMILTGCPKDQPVLISYTNSTLSLTPKFLPDPPAGMVYELWVYNLSTNADSLIARFDWDADLYIMRDPSTGNKIDPVFGGQFNLLDWDLLIVSVEYESFNASFPRAIMLWDLILPPDRKEQLVMGFPIDFSSTASGIMSLETPTDGNTGSDQFGVWFAIYSTGNLRTVDTTNVSIQNNSRQFIARNQNLDDSLGTTMDTIGIDSLFPVTYNVYSRFDLDTFQVNTRRIFYKIVPINLTTDTVTYVFGGAMGMSDTVKYPPNQNCVFNLLFNTANSVDHTIHQFQNGFTDLPSLRNTGWHYRGWVLGPHTGSGPASFRKMANGANLVFNWEKTNRLLFSTGIFYDTIVDSSTILGVDSVSFGADSFLVKTFRQYKNEAGYNTIGSDPHPFHADANASVPPFPGEDFMRTGLANDLGVTLTDGAPLSSAFDFISRLPSDTAIAFITVEPDIYTDSTVNFPLILLASEIALPVFDNVDMINQSGFTWPHPNDRMSWPHIVVVPELK